MSDDLESFYSDDNPEFLLRLREFLHYLLVPVIISIIVVLYLEFFRHVGHALHQKLALAERGILFYFVAEVGLDFVLFENKWEFLKEKWFDILLILPFLAVFRAAGRLGRVFQGLRSLRVLQLGNVPLAAGILAGEGAQGAKAIKSVSKIAKYVPKLQKTLHLLRELPSVASYIPRVQSIVYVISELKRFGNRAIQVLLGVGILKALSDRLLGSRSHADDGAEGDRTGEEREATVSGDSAGAAKSGTDVSSSATADGTGDETGF